MLKIKKFDDEQGNLCVIEGDCDIPFKIQRIFYIFGADKECVRGKHANLKSRFFLFAIKGHCRVRVDDGKMQDDFSLDSPDKGLLLDKMAWKEMYGFSQDCILVVLSDEKYDKCEYIYDYNEFVNHIN